MKLTPMKTSGSLLGWLMTKGMIKVFGKPLLSTRVSHARLPSLWWGLLAFMRIENSFTFDRALGLLIHSRASMVNNCAFCQDIGQAFAVQQKMGLDRFKALWSWQDSNLFSEKERAALAYIDAINAHDQEAIDQTFLSLERHFSERQIVEITAQNAIANFHNLINMPLGLEGDGLVDLAQKKQIGQSA